jgi:hypothetical protein
MARAEPVEPPPKSEWRASSLYIVRQVSWTVQDELGYRAFIAGLGESECATLDECLRSAANPFRESDSADKHFEADCAELPYVLRFYYAWKRGLPFSYESAVAARGKSGDLRYTQDGNSVAARSDVPSGVLSGYEIIARIRASVSSANYRIHPDLETSLPTDFYSPALDPKSIVAGTVLYDPAGHLAIVYRVDGDGRVHFFDAHTDFSLTQMTYDLRFARAQPAAGAGFKNWRPIHLIGARRRADGALVGGHIVLDANEDIADFSDEQFYGNAQRPTDANWASGTFTLNGETMDYYDYVRAKLAGGRLQFDPISEIRDMVDASCSDLHYREVAVDLAISARIQNKPEPDRLPENIYGTAGLWETYSTPSRDARLKTLFKEIRDSVQRFVQMQAKGGDTHLTYAGPDLAGDLLKTYDREAKSCIIVYTRSDGSQRTLSYEEMRLRLFRMSFDPYQCVERRWGASEADELSTCGDDPVKQVWYKAEQNLRNQTDRTYGTRMDFTLDALNAPGPGKGVAAPPDTDARAYLAAQSAFDNAP